MKPKPKRTAAAIAAITILSQGSPWPLPQLLRAGPRRERVRARGGRAAATAAPAPMLRWCWPTVGREEVVLMLSVRAARPAPWAEWCWPRNGCDTEPAGPAPCRGRAVICGLPGATGGVARLPDSGAPAAAGPAAATALSRARLAEDLVGEWRELRAWGSTAVVSPALLPRALVAPSRGLRGGESWGSPAGGGRLEGLHPAWAEQRDIVGAGKGLLGRFGEWPGA